MQGRIEEEATAVKKKKRNWTDAWRYLRAIPKTVPSGKVVVHNQVRPVARLVGERGSRIWLSPRNPTRLVRCHCPWAPELGRHYKVKGL